MPEPQRDRITDKHSDFMILPIQRSSGHGSPPPSARLYGIPLDDPALSAIPVEIAAAPRRSATSPSRSPSSWPAGCARRRASIAQEIVAALGPIDGVTRIEAAPNGYMNFFLDRPRSFLPARWLRPAAAPDAARRKDDRRAHGHQSEQGGAHRPPAERGARRHVRAAAAVPRTRRSRSRTTSTTPACRSPTSSVGFRELEQQDARRGPRARRRRRGSTTTAGTSTRASPSGTRRTRSGWRSARAALHDIEHGGNDTGRAGRVHRRSHRPLPSRRRWRG